MSRKTKRILLANDFPCFGEAALPAMISLLAGQEYEVYKLPTLLVSNTFNYGQYASLDTTDYLMETVSVWEKRGVSFDAVAVGLVANARQADFLKDFCRSQQEKGAVIFFDPILGDHGKYYQRVTDDNIKASHHTEAANQIKASHHTEASRHLENAKRLVCVADYITPNYTEACLLTGVSYQENELSWLHVEMLLGKLHELGAISSVITGIRMDGGHFIACYDHKNGEYSRQEYKEIPGTFYGTGDRFSAVLTAEILKGSSLSAGVRAAADAVSAALQKGMQPAE